jgi:SAM-dependent methyltransferase
MASIDFPYAGTELALFAKAVNWKRYWRSQLQPYLDQPRILEVGAGVGATTQALCDVGSQRDLWLGLEPDYQLYRQACAKQAELPAHCQFRHGTLDALTEGEQFDTILYIDVLEHIAHDAAEVQHAAEHLKQGGHLIVLSPAYQYLYSAFDHAIGHYRRYTRSTLSKLTPPTLRVRRMFYLDSVGLLTSLANKLILHAPLPTADQIHLWDSRLIPVSRFIDPLLFYSMGRSVIGIWEKH